MCGEGLTPQLTRKNWQGKVAEELNRSFNEPFMPEGFCEAKVSKNGRDGNILRIKMGDRDTEFDTEGNSVGSGSRVGDAKKWLIQKAPEGYYPPVFDED